MIEIRNMFPKLALGFIPVIDGSHRKIDCKVAYLRLANNNFIGDYRDIKIIAEPAKKD
jgi:hypothetical protein